MREKCRILNDAEGWGGTGMCETGGTLPFNSDIQTGCMLTRLASEEYN
jgi:hypothetical protein